MDFQSAQFDTNEFGTIYAVTTSGALVVFETYQTITRPDHYDCKMTQIFRSSESANFFDLRVMKNSLVIRDAQGKYMFHNKTKGSNNQVVTYGQSRNPTEIIRENAKLSDSKVSASLSSLLVARVPGTKDQLELIECMHPQLKADSLFDAASFSSMRFPMFLIALGFVVLYQVYQRRNGEKLDQETEGIA